MARWYVLILCASLGACPLSAQQSVTIDGTILESGADVPIPGAKVVLCYSTSFAPISSAVTDATGSFHLSIHEPGAYSVEAGAPGYLEGRVGGAGIEVDAGALDAAATPTVRTITIRLSRSAVIEGRIRDGDTRKPFHLLTVRALRIQWMRGKRQISEEGVGFTDGEGAFRFAGVPAGNYFLEISKHTPDSPPSKDAGKYPILLWPDAGSATTSSMRVQPGGEFHAGVIDYSRSVLPRLRINVTSNCPEGMSYRLSVAQDVGGALVDRQTVDSPCATPLAIDSLSPGRYHLEQRSLDRLPSISGADIILREGTDLDLELKPIRVSIISGKVICNCKAAFPDPGGRQAKITLTPLDSGLPTAADIREDGTFSTVMLFLGMARVDIGPMPQDMYVESLIYNGADQGQYLRVSPGAGGSLEITLADRPASLNGRVVKDGKPFMPGRVVLGRWPVPPDGNFKSAEIGSEGSFTISNLPPATYRVAHMSLAEWDRRDEPETIAAVLASGLEITLEADQTRALVLELP